MNRSHTIINDLEESYGQTLDTNDIPDVLCNGDTCRHSECECWTLFSQIVEDRLIKQEQDERAEFDSMRRLYRAEVSYGLHVTESAKNAADAVA